MNEDEKQDQEQPPKEPRNDKLRLKIEVAGLVLTSIAIVVQVVLR